MELNAQELSSINGGGTKFGIYLAIGGLLSFLVGVIDGYLRPLSCNK